MAAAMPMYRPEDCDALDEKQLDLCKELELSAEKVKTMNDRSRQALDKEIQEKNMNKALRLNANPRRYDPLYIVLVGKTGHGKSETANTLCGRRLFEARSSSSSVTKDLTVHSMTYGDRTIEIIDTPGLFDTDVNDDVIVSRIKSQIKRHVPNGVHVIFYMYNITAKFTEEEKKTKAKVESIFKDKIYKHTAFVFTFADATASTLETYLMSGEDELKTFIRNNLKSRALSINNMGAPYYKKKMQKILITMAYNIAEQNSGKCLSEADINWLFKVICFPPSATVNVLGQGLVQMDSVKIGDHVLCCDTQGKLFYDPVILFSHADDEGWALYVTIQVESGETISLSPNHLLPVGDVNNLKPASDVQIGDVVFIAKECGNVEPNIVMTISQEGHLGAYCPYTKCGTVVVDGVVASCYTTIIPVWLAHALLFPTRLLYNVLPLSWFKTITACDEQKGMPALITKYRKFLPVQT